MTREPEGLGRRERDDAIAAPAAQWMARRERGLSSAEQTELRAWLAADRRHGRELSRIDGNASELDWPIYTGTVERVLAGLEASGQRRRRARRRVALVSAGAIAVAVLGFFTVQRGVFRTTPSLVIVLPETRTLADGSTVELKDDAEVRVAFSATERRVQLLRGAAHFQVRKDPARPFLVSAGTITARAVGTAFVVSLEPEQVAVVVTEGRVAVDPVSAPRGLGPAEASTGTLVVVEAGKSIAVVPGAAADPNPQVTELVATDTAARLGWRVPRLDFNRAPLGEIVAIVNRHNQEQLVIRDPGLEAIKLSGAVRANRIDALLELLESDFHVRVERQGTTIYLQRE